MEGVQYTGNNNKTSDVDGRELGWKNERELGNSSQVGEKKVSVLEDRDRLGSVCSAAPKHDKNTFCNMELNLGCSYLNNSLLLNPSGKCHAGRGCCGKSKVSALLKN